MQASSYVLLQCFSLWSLIWGISKGNATAGDLALVIAINSSVADVLYNLSRYARSFAEDLGKVSQGLRILPLGKVCQDQIQYFSNSINVHDVKIGAGEIVFKNVSFRYQDSPLLFSNKTLTISAGQKIGLVGHSGSGKSTFVNLILRMFDLHSGQIFIDGQDVSRLSTEQIGQFISIIPQEPQLFHRSLRDNIRYGKLDATEEEIIAAAKTVQAHDFINNLPEGYDSLVGERGVKLSGGQKQRIAIARAILKNAPILILDEATSGLDLVVESEVQENIWRLMKGKTMLVIAHRLTTLLQMDRTLVFKEGKIVEAGNHAELLAKNGVYRALWEMQNKLIL